jgi:hypothetical protein
LLLWRVLGALALGQALCLGAAGVGPDRWAGLVTVPLFGRFLQAGVWLWLLGADRVSLPRRPLALLLAHDAFWLAAFAVYLAVWALGRGQRRGDGGSGPGGPETSGGSSPSIP